MNFPVLLVAIRLLCCSSLYLGHAGAKGFGPFDSIADALSNATKSVSDAVSSPSPKKKPVRLQRKEHDKGHTTSSPEVHVLAFGDSLTARYYVKEGWPDKLSELLNSHGKGKEYRVHSAAIVGENTTHMVNRLAHEIGHLESLHQKPSFVIILGGTNDLWQANPGQHIPMMHKGALQVLRNLEAMRATVANAGATAVLVAIPPYSAGLPPAAREINLALKDAAKDGSFLFADISQVDRKYLIDNLHYSEDGYARFAEQILKAMRPRL